MTHVVVDPVTRIEGHLRIEAEVDGGAVKEAWSSSTMFRGIELILRGRDLQGVTSLLATHRVQDAFGLAHFRFDKQLGRVVALNGKSATASGTRKEDAPPTNVVVLREGRVYFSGTTDDVLNSSDDYLKKFLASAE